MTTLIGDRRVADIAVHDNREPLVDLATRGIACTSPPDCPGARLVRTGVADRLARADAALPAGVRLLVVEGFRTADAQQQILDWYSERVRVAHPEAGEGEVRRLSSRYVAPLEVAPHVAGAAVDLTLVDADGTRLDLGTAVDMTPEDSAGACAFDAPGISQPARENRAMLATALTGAGLVNYPTEWWHWSYGDRYWAHLTGASQACYGPVRSDRHAESSVGSRR